MVSNYIFVKTKANTLTSEDFSEYIRESGIDEFYIIGADAMACVKSTCYNMNKVGYTVNVISDCVTSYDLKKMPGMLSYYADKGYSTLMLRKSSVGILSKYTEKDNWQGQKPCRD